MDVPFFETLNFERTSAWLADITSVGSPNDPSSPPPVTPAPSAAQEEVDGATTPRAAEDEGEGATTPKAAQDEGDDGTTLPEYITYADLSQVYINMWDLLNSYGRDIGESSAFLTSEIQQAFHTLLENIANEHSSRTNLTYEPPYHYNIGNRLSSSALGYLAVKFASSVKTALEDMAQLRSMFILAGVRFDVYDPIAIKVVNVEEEYFVPLLQHATMLEVFINDIEDVLKGRQDSAVNSWLLEKFDDGGWKHVRSFLGFIKELLEDGIRGVLNVQADIAAAVGLIPSLDLHSDDKEVAFFKEVIEALATNIKGLKLTLLMGSGAIVK